MIVTFSRLKFQFSLQIQTKETPHLCDICGKSFGRPAALKNHLKYHYSDFNAECYLCKHRVTSLTCLQKHLRIHVSSRTLLHPEHGPDLINFMISYLHPQDWSETLHMFALPEILLRAAQS